MINLLTLLDDIAATMDDVAVMTKVALKKTSALMTDDLAVNAGVVQGVQASRELPIVGSIFLGSLINKIICIVIVLLINYFYPPILLGLLFLGGCYLAYEGADKVIEKIIGKKSNEKIPNKEISEKQKIWGAIKTDFVLSMEILVLAQKELTGSILEKTISLTLVGLAASILIYGLVAILVKIDDFGLFLINKGNNNLGEFLVNLTPKMMKGLGILGTIAMFLVAGGIFTHTFHLPILVWEHAQNLILGLISGLSLVGIITQIKKLFLAR